MIKEHVIPQNSPLYTPLPHNYKNIHWCSVICRSKRNLLERFVQEPLELPSDERLLFEVFVSHYKESEVGSYHEAGIIVPVNYKNINASHFSNLYLDSDAGIAAGREIIGFPKKYAGVYYNESENIVTGSVVRKEKPIFSIYGDFKKPVQVDRLPVAPRLQVRYIPKADGPGSDLHQVVATRWPPDKGTKTVKIHDRKTGSANVIFGKSDEEDFTMLNAAEVLGAVKVHLDFSLDYATVIDNIE